MAILNEVRATTSSYTDKDGKKKNTYKTVGYEEQGQYGRYIRLDASFNPAGIPRKEGCNFIILNLVQPYQQRNNQQQQGNNSARTQSATGGDSPRWQSDLAFAEPNPADTSFQSDLPF